MEGTNPHVLLEGQSGSGKSLAAKHIAFERMRQGQDVSVVDTHNPEAWGGASRVFQGTNKQAGESAARFLRESLESRKEEASAAKMRGEVPDFKPMTVVFSDFARLMKDTPQLGEEFKTLLTEARKFRISIVADTTALTGASSGIKGIQDVLQNFGQKVKFFAPTPQGDPRRAQVAGKMYDTPVLPDYKEKIDFGLVKTPPPPPPPEPKQKIGMIDSLLKQAESMRGVMGGMFGGLAGIALDTTAAARRHAQGGGEGGMDTAAMALGGVAIAAVAVVKTFNLLDNEVQKSISRYADYSPEIAQAQAQAEVVTMLNDMRRAQEYGPEIARYIQAQTELQNQWEDVKMKFMEAAMPIMEGIMKALSAILGIGNWYRNREDEVDVDAIFNFDPFSIQSGGIGGATMPGGPQANNIF